MAIASDTELDLAKNKCILSLARLIARELNPDWHPDFNIYEQWENLEDYFYNKEHMDINCLDYIAKIETNVLPIDLKDRIDKEIRKNTFEILTINDRYKINAYKLLTDLMIKSNNQYFGDTFENNMWSEGSKLSDLEEKRIHSLSNFCIEFCKTHK